MFTGIIESKGQIEAIVPTGEDMRLRVATGKLDLTDVVCFLFDYPDFSLCK